jgi:hypothetical protein
MDRNMSDRSILNDIREVPGVPRIWAIVKATNMVSSTNKNEKGK